MAGSCDEIFAFSLRFRPSFRVKYHLRMFQHVSLYFSAVFLCFLRGAAATKKIPRRPRPATRGDQFFDDLDPACRIFLELFHDPRPRTLQIPRPTTWRGGRGRGTTVHGGLIEILASFCTLMDHDNDDATIVSDGVQALQSMMAAALQLIDINATNFKGTLVGQAICPWKTRRSWKRSRRHGRVATLIAHWFVCLCLSVSVCRVTFIDKQTTLGCRRGPRRATQNNCRQGNRGA